MKTLETKALPHAITHTHWLPVGHELDIASWICDCGTTGQAKDVTSSYRAAAIHMEISTARSRSRRRHQRH